MSEVTAQQLRRSLYVAFLPSALFLPLSWCATFEHQFVEYFLRTVGGFAGSDSAISNIAWLVVLTLMTGCYAAAIILNRCSNINWVVHFSGARREEVSPNVGMGSLYWTSDEATMRLRREGFEPPQFEIESPNDLSGQEQEELKNIIRGYIFIYGSQIIAGTYLFAGILAAFAGHSAWTNGVGPFIAVIAIASIVLEGLLYHLFRQTNARLAAGQNMAANYS